MSLRLVVPEDNPTAFWMLDGTSPHVDASGRGRTATSTSTAYHAALVKGATRALVVSNSSKLSVNAPVYRQGFEHLPWSAEVAFRSIKKDPSSTAPQQVFGNSGAYDGLTITGTVVSFSTKYANTGEAKCSFDIQENRAVVAAVVHTLEKNSLYINDELVAEVDITPEQQLDTYASPGTNLTCGETTSTNLLALNALSLYRNVLAAESISRHYDEATDNLAEAAVATAFGGAWLDLSPEASNPYFVQTYTSEQDWKTGRMEQVITEYDQLVPQVRDGVSIAGNWYTIVSLPQDLGTLYGVTIMWEGEGALVHTSLDGETWTQASKGLKVSTIPSGFDPTGQFLQVRVSFLGGITNDESYADDLSISVYLSGSLPPVAGRAVTINNASIEGSYDIMDYNENNGLELNSGSLTLAAPEAGGMDVKTVEIWMKNPATSSLGTNLTGASAIYSDGSTSKNLAVDEWQCRTYVFNATITGAITISGTGQVASIVLYPYAMTAEQANASYMSYVGIPSFTTNVDDILSIIELSDLVDVYEYEWSIESAG